MGQQDWRLCSMIAIPARAEATIATHFGYLPGLGSIHAVTIDELVGVYGIAAKHDTVNFFRGAKGSSWFGDGSRHKQELLIIGHPYHL
jgi:hypothetical protein